MSEPHRRLIEKITDASYLDDFEAADIALLREMRAECREAENELSFERKLCHARMDILSAELDRRSGASAGDLVDRLPEILGATERGPAERGPLPSRAPDFSIPRNADVPRRRVEEILGEGTLSRLPQLQAEEIRSIVGSLAEHEQRVSQRRREVHDVMDRLQAEIVRRYTSGEADPSAALG
jgi:RsiG-like